MIETQDAVKVRLASVQPTPEGFVLLKMTTSDGIEVEFLLDDLALSLLGITYGPVVESTKRRLDNNPEDVRLHTFNEESK